MGRKLNGWGLVDFTERDPQALAERLDEVLGRCWRCAPGANARTKALLLASVDEPIGVVLDRGGAVVCRGGQRGGGS